jgi:hypothetical protein
MKAEFDGTAEVGLGPRPYSGKEVHSMAKKINVVLGKGTRFIVETNTQGASV